MSDATYVCINAETQEFVPFDEYVCIEVARMCQELGRICDEEGAPAGHPLRERALADAAVKIEAAMRASQAAQIEAFGAVKH